MGFQDNRKKIPFVRSLRFALNGLRISARERNMKIHYTAAVLVTIFGVIFSISWTEWLFVFTCVGGVIALEMINTAIEKTVDLVTDQYHELARQAKDLAAGAVLVYALYSVAAGLVIFLPKIISLLHSL